MTRRSPFVLAALALALASVGARAVPAQSGDAQNRSTPQTASRPDYRELTADQQVMQVLNRLSFGPRPGDVQRVRSVGVDKWIEQQLYPQHIDDHAVETFVGRFELLNRDADEMLRDFAEAQRDRRMTRRQLADTSRTISAADSVLLRQYGQQRRRLVTELQAAKVARAVASNRQLQEVLSDFWFNHFNVFIGKGAPEPFYLATYEREAIRPHALGRFRDLLAAVAKSPAMLFYLDNARSMGDSTQPRLVDPARQRAGMERMQRMPRRRVPNGGAMRARLEAMTSEERREVMQRLAQARRGGLNENYGRELLELHTLGVDGGYTQQDVVNVARAFTGWTIRQPQQGGGFIFRPQLHDAGEKIVLGHKLRAGRGIEDGEQVLDIVARHPATARHIATKLARRFVHDDPPQGLVDHAAAVFLKTDGDIREVVRAIVTSNEFFSRAAYRSKVKSPFEVVVSTARALDAAPDPTPRTALAVAYLGQPLYGNQAPNGYPETGSAWMNTGAILNRINFGMQVAANRLPGVRVSALPEVHAVSRAPRDRQVDVVVTALLGGAASPETRRVLLSGENPLAARLDSGTSDVTRRQATPMVMQGGNSANITAAGAGGARRRQALERAMAPVPQLTGVAQIVGLALGSPEFQRR